MTSLKATIDEYSNPFLETSGDLLVLDTRDIVEKSDVMKKNNIHLFNTPHKRQKTKTSELVLSLKSDRNLFSRLYVCCISVS